jgi:hypothetical protein
MQPIIHDLQKWSKFCNNVKICEIGLSCVVLEMLRTFLMILLA